MRAVTSADGNKSDWMDGKCHFSSSTPVAAFLEETGYRLEPEQQLSEAALSSEDGDAVISIGTKRNANTTAAS